MILMKFDPEIKGDSKIEKHTGWIAVENFQFGVGRAISVSAEGADRDTSNPSFSEVSIAKAMDIASPQLFIEAACGKAMNSVTFHWVQTGGKDAKGQHFLEVVLKKPILSSYSAASAGERPSESLSINYNEIQVTYSPFEEGGTAKPGKPKGYDLKANKAVP